MPQVQGGLHIILLNMCIRDMNQRAKMSGDSQSRPGIKKCQIASLGAK
jgi:hypothetical protein